MHEILEEIKNKNKSVTIYLDGNPQEVTGNVVTVGDGFIKFVMFEDRAQTPLYIAISHIVAVW